MAMQAALRTAGATGGVPVKAVVRKLKPVAHQARDVNGFCPAHAAQLQQFLADVKAGRNLVHHDLITGNRRRGTTISIGRRRTKKR
jgi:hypothetical protein